MVNAGRFHQNFYFARFFLISVFQFRRVLSSGTNRGKKYPGQFVQPSFDKYFFKYFLMPMYTDFSFFRLG